MEYEIFELQQKLSRKLAEKRFYHSLGVQATSFAMAIQIGADADTVEKANLAGLMHDCAKYLSDEKMLMRCKKYNLAISEVETRNPYLLHGKLGAYYAEYKYGIIDADILSAITYHTTGKPDMTLLEKIVFTADYIEPNRSENQIPDLNEIRKLAFDDLDKAVYRILENTLYYLKGEHQEIDNLTVEAYDYYKKHQKTKFERGSR